MVVLTHDIAGTVSSGERKGNKGRAVPCMCSSAACIEVLDGNPICTKQRTSFLHGHASRLTNNLFGAQGFSEISNMVVKAGGKLETMSTTAGFGDIVLTCYGNQSRNWYCTTEVMLVSLLQFLGHVPDIRRRLSVVGWSIMH